MTTIFTAIHTHQGFQFGPRAASYTDLLTRAFRAYGVYRQRQHLKALSDRQLADIGISRRDAEIEATRSFWDLPTSQFRTE